MKFAVLVFPGSNCDDDLVYVLREIMGQSVVKIWHKDHDLQGAEVVMVPGGFAYGDYLRAGAIARFSPIMREVAAHAQRGGYVWGICNGFQILTEAGLLEGALLRNLSRQYICKNIYLRTLSTQTLLTRQLDSSKAYCIPMAHGEGRYYAPMNILKKLQDQDQILFQYCEADGSVSEAANLNGSLLNIAGICNPARNVFGMMPHPERAADEMLGNTDGRLFFESLLGTLLEKV
ncbi:MAG: phosphoribosylformylglycinamidine synthase subunit PurQ [Microscillaceae bacterium]|nr:phosphoribosylformylglycinamidine synthase subunit PurQ [Microscillaceae bacterium]